MDGWMDGAHFGHVIDTLQLSKAQNVNNKTQSLEWAAPKCWASSMFSSKKMDGRLGARNK